MIQPSPTIKPPCCIAPHDKSKYILYATCPLRERQPLPEDDGEEYQYLLDEKG